MPEHGGGLSVFTVIMVVAGGAALLLLTYARLARLSRGATWPWSRSLCWVAAMVATVVGAVIVNGAASADHDPVRHMIGHVVLAMAVPLLLAWSAPLTLVLRALPVRAARRLVGVLRSRPVAVLTTPYVAAALDAGGLWILYRTPVGALAEQHPVVGAAVWVHLVGAGWLLSTVLVGADRGLRRSPLVVRAVVLVLVIASHDVLTKLLYADAVDDRSRTAAMIMYYGGDAVHLAMIIGLGRLWFARSERTRRRLPARPVISSGRWAAGR